MSSYIEELNSKEVFGIKGGMNTLAYLFYLYGYGSSPFAPRR